MQGDSVKRLATVLLWSVIAAAFIGPGTVTSAASAGAEFGYSLLWALLFSTIACLVLQEASGRLTVVSGKNLGQALGARYPRGWRRFAVLALVLGAVVVGCAAYEAGNILGGAAGAMLSLSWSAQRVAVATVAVAALLLWFNSPQRVATMLSLLVATMGVAFLFTAVRLAPAGSEVLAGLLRPTLPEGSTLLAIALVGTTVVPYNLFLGSGLARGQTLAQLRFGLAIAVLFGGLISMAVIVVGAALHGGFGFSELADVLVERLGPWARGTLGAGLFAAGLSSAVTAPLAAAITARSVLGDGDETRWADGSWRFRSVWGGVLAVGLVFGVSGIRAVPVIILAQALNGVLLPVVAVFLFVAVNDAAVMGSARNGVGSNLVMGLVTAVTILLGTSGVLRAGARGLAQPPPGELVVIGVAAAAALVVGVGVAGGMRRGGGA